MEEKQKKLLICLLLLISCLASAFLFVYVPAATPQRLSDFEQADSLIIASLEKFDITREQISESSIAMDSVYTRIAYYVTVPPDFSKTQFHLELSHTFSPFNVAVPANVFFPEQDMTIHLVHHQTVIRSIMLRIEPDPAQEQHSGNILISTEPSLAEITYRRAKS